MKTTRMMATVLVAASMLAARTVRADNEPQHKHEGHQPAAHADDSTTVTGEVLDLACYLDHGAAGEKHASCAKTCIESGLPVGIKTADGKVYLLIGEHKPLNKELARYAAKTITVRGKLVSRDGISMLENVEVLK
jgi:hypothetical protein